ncbi:hypothetical protein G7068_13755 [Leucobacter viscericola]|uniref:Uncharacterized protein n=1 Tax=Leucobacter viscericola TaxID=2714935 RepID=A0A6G7XHQ4_9MICO|nr:hypothetical protein [Leucobacter viscericola]QIK64144.1 hypothetical protein G7068_13755 [Leucobacter viscericola]
MYGDWQLIYEGTDLRFGTREHNVEFVKLTVSGDVYRTDDSQLPRQDGTAFGQDFIESGQLAIAVKIDFTTYPAGPDECARLAWAARQAFERGWRADPVRRTPGAVCELVMGGEQAIEGRPRGVSWNDDHQGVGLITGSALFVPAGTGVFDMSDGGGWHTQTVGLVPPQTGGLKAPLKAPLSTSVESSRARPFTVAGDVPAWPIITVKGPLGSGAQVELTSRWRMPLNRSLGAFDVVEIDTRPGHRGMTLNGRAANVLTSGAVQLADAAMAPGPQELALRGTSLEGTATASVRWRTTKESI